MQNHQHSTLNTHTHTHNKKRIARNSPSLASPHLNNKIPAKLLKIRVRKLFDCVCVCVWTSADMRKHPFTGQYWKNGSVILTLCMPCILRSSTCKASNRAMNYNTSSVAPFFFYWPNVSPFYDTRSHLYDSNDVRLLGLCRFIIDDSAFVIDANQ